MSRKTRRNAFRKAARASRAAADRATYAKLGLSGFTLGSMAFGSTLFAAEPADGPDGAAASKSSQPQELQEVVVTGIRASLQRAMEIKQQSVGVVDAVSAEDIGQFPDASIGEALSRIPGVTVNRGSITGMASAGAPTATGNPSGITVRGFGTQFNEILTEGRPVASGNGQNFDFSALGAEYVGQLDIHKTPDFTLSTGAVGATINIKSPRPFDRPGLQARAFGAATDYQKDGGVRPAFGALLSDTFFDDTFGILVAGDYTDKHILAHHFDIVGWKGAYLNSCQMTGGPVCTTDAKGNFTNPVNTKPSWYIQDQAMYLERTDSRRKDGRVAVQWRPADTVLVTLDDNYSSDSETIDRWQYSTWFGCMPATCTNVTQDTNGTITNFTNPGGPTDFNAFANQTYITTNTPGLNVSWEPNENWAGTLDVSQSTSHLNPNHTWTSLDADVGYGNATNNYTGGVAVPGGKTLPYWTAYGPNSTAGTSSAFSPNFLGLNPYIIGSHVLPIQEQYNTDKINQAKIEGAWKDGDTQVKLGMQFVQDVWDSSELDTFTNNEWQLWSGYGPASGNTQGVALPSNLFSPTNVSPFISGFNGGNLPPSLLMYNPYAVLNYLVTQPADSGYTPSKGYPNYVNGTMPAPVLSPGSVQHVDRKNYAPFAAATETFPIGDMNLKVNVGLRYQKTLVDIAGLAAPLTSLGVLSGDLTAYQFNLAPAIPTTAHNSYGYFLPSLDLNLNVRPDLKVRVDYSRTESPANNQQLIPNTTFNGRVNALTAQGNNPLLLPYLSQNFDLGAEWYYGSNDYVAVDGFFKHVTQFPVSTVTSITVPGVIDTSDLSPNKGNLAVFQESTITNGLAANVHGVEITWQQMLPYGFGFQANGTYAHSNSNFDPYALTSNQFALPGVGNSANLIAFYQNYGFQARIAVQWQGEQLLQIGQEQNGGSFPNEPTYLESNTEVDFSTQYDINSHFNVFFEAINLTENVYHTRGRFDNQTLNVVDYGRSFTFGVRAKL